MRLPLFSGILILGIIACGVVLFMLISTSAGPIPEPRESLWSGGDGIIAYVSQGNLLEPYFREPFETSIMIFPDYDIATWSTHDDSAIFGSATERIKYLQSIGRRIEDVAAIVHNHATPHPFSKDGDEKMCRDFRGYGFTGKYGIYYPFKKKDRITWMTEGK